jgi:hypothetical protein
MPTRIVQYSPHVCAFYDQLKLKLSKQQRQHLLNLTGALLVSEDEKTLDALQRQFIAAPDASNVADFLCIGPLASGGCAERITRQPGVRFQTYLHPNSHACHIDIIKKRVES